MSKINNHNENIQNNIHTFILRRIVKCNSNNSNYKPKTNVWYSLLLISCTQKNINLTTMCDNLNVCLTKSNKVVTVLHDSKCGRISQLTLTLLKIKTYAPMIVPPLTNVDRDRYYC